MPKPASAYLLIRILPQLHGSSPWDNNLYLLQSFLRENFKKVFKRIPQSGFEPPTHALEERCSRPSELLGLTYRGLDRDGLPPSHGLSAGYRCSQLPARIYDAPLSRHGSSGVRTLDTLIKNQVLLPTELMIQKWEHIHRLSSLYLPASHLRPNLRH